MRLAGVRLDGGAFAWVDAGDHDLQPLDRVDIRMEGQVRTGDVYITPELIVAGGAEPSGVLLAVHRPSDTNERAELPGADMPPLGPVLSVEGVTGRVTQIDAVNRTVVLRDADGGETTVTWPSTGMNP